MSPLIGVFDLFRIGLGPSSSHTVGPMRAAREFILRAAPSAARAARVEATLYGSLAWTGKGHGTDVAILAGLAGMAPATSDPDAVHALPAAVAASGRLDLAGIGPIPFNLASDLVFDRTTPTPEHPNTMRLRLSDAGGAVLAEETWFSVGGGFVVREGETPPPDAMARLPYPFRSARDMLAHCAERRMTLSEMQFANECAVHTPEAVRAHIAAVDAAMTACIERGLMQDGILPGGLKVRRRSRTLAERIVEKRRRNLGGSTEAMDHASLWAIASVEPPRLRRRFSTMRSARVGDGAANLQAAGQDAILHQAAFDAGGHGAPRPRCGRGPPRACGPRIRWRTAFRTASSGAPRNVPACPVRSGTGKAAGPWRRVVGSRLRARRNRRRRKTRFPRQARHRQRRTGAGASCSGVRGGRGAVEDQVACQVERNRPIPARSSRPLAATAAGRACTTSGSEVAGAMPARPASIATSVPWPLPRPGERSVKRRLPPGRRGPRMARRGG